VRPGFPNKGALEMQFAIVDWCFNVEPKPAMHPLASDFGVQFEVDLNLGDGILIRMRSSQRLADFPHLFVVEEVRWPNNGTRPSPNKSKLTQPKANCFASSYYRILFRQGVRQDLKRPASPRVTEILGRGANRRGPIWPPGLCREGLFRFQE
jgi:hypothetical protein